MMHDKRCRALFDTRLEERYDDQVSINAHKLGS